VKNVENAMKEKQKQKNINIESIEISNVLRFSGQQKSQRRLDVRRREKTF